MSATTKPNRPSVEYVMGLARVMQALGVTRITVGEVTLERPMPMPEEAAPPPVADERERAFEELRKMSPEAQENALRLRRMGA